MLETRGYAVKTALDTVEGIRLLREGDVDLVLSSNTQVVREVQKLALLIPAIYVAAKARSSCKEADAVMKHGSQSPVEVLSAVRDLIKKFKLAHLKETR